MGRCITKIFRGVRGYMNIELTKLEGVVIITPDIFGDHRGYFMESWSQRKMEEAGL